MFITSKNHLNGTCEGCKKKDFRETFEVNNLFYCLTCATRKVFGKATSVTRNLVKQFENGVEYECLLDFAYNTIVNGTGDRSYRVTKARRAIRHPFIFRNVGVGQYVILCPAGKKRFEAINKFNKANQQYTIDPDSPFNSICDHVQDQINKGLPLKDVAEFIWSIRGKHDNITAMMYPRFVTVTWPYGQKDLYPQ